MKSEGINLEPVDTLKLSVSGSDLPFNALGRVSDDLNSAFASIRLATAPIATDLQLTSSIADGVLKSFREVDEELSRATSIIAKSAKFHEFSDLAVNLSSTTAAFNALGRVSDDLNSTLAGIRLATAPIATERHLTSSITDNHIKSFREADEELSRTTSRLLERRKRATSGVRQSPQ